MVLANMDSHHSSLKQNFCNQTLKFIVYCVLAEF